ncbi:transcription termination factor MTERF5, chloroplastic-like [Cornus florida]|uniref:transcription termination factor MTERF5, chloroplastic-like n=1 Tax=Cornus florida TaxID=4283 RepID=UPI0028979153|nr:transcription termination factor MTERF5, chloroplastic-like [Cornus florida]XP_059653714.1 transcription termination factor MTERF5, chloroplastic-like [Cornus florida]XP_059653715.1 transcription termination factor MTERF5, chloroplastic-like [Cornus florida]XP_059653716.1 transcription termination factor MTERF5, chloroplastic-like [Cornus florida]
MGTIHFKRLVCFVENYQFLKRTPHSAAVFQKRFLKTETETVSATAAAAESSSFTLRYLVDSCGLPYKTALSTSQKLKLEEKNSEQPESVITLLKSLEFSDDQIAKLIVKNPPVLQYKINSNLKPKLQYLIDIGFVGSFLPELILKNPYILGRSLTGHIKPSIDFLKTYLETDDNVVAALRRSSWLLTSDFKGTMTNINFLLSEGVPHCSISKLILLQPRVIQQKLDRMVYAVNTVRNLGYKPSAPMFLPAVRVMVSMNDSTWKRKVELLKSFGWSDEEIFIAFKRCPLYLECSEEKIKSMMDFYVNTVKLEPSVMVAYPILLKFAKDTRILPRYNVIKVLESKKLLKENKKVTWIFCQPEKKFLDMYVNKHLDKVPRLMDIYRGIIVADKIDA